MKYYSLILWLGLQMGLPQAKAENLPSDKFNFLVQALNLKDISSEYVVVNVWSPNCEPCGKEVGQLNQIFSQDKNLENKISIVGTPVDGRKKETDEFIAYFKPLYQQAYLSTAAKDQLFKIGRTPFTILFNKKRNLVQEWTGSIMAIDLISAITKQERPHNENER